MKVKKRKIKQKAKSYSQKIKEKAFVLFDEETEETQHIIDTLNKLSSLKTAPTILQKCPLSSALATMIEYEQTYNGFGGR